MSTTFFAITASDTLTGDMTLGLEYAEFNVSASDAREIELALDYAGTEAGDVVAGDLPVKEFLGRLTDVPAKDRTPLVEMAWNLADEAVRMGADFIAWG